MAVEFVKYHGTGNDFVVVDESERRLADWVALAPSICDRNKGIGADGILVVSSEPRMIVINRDGSRPQMCGNGVRIVARHLVETIGAPRELVVQTDAGPRRCIVDSAEPFDVDVDMGSVVHRGTVDWNGEGRTWSFAHVDVGNPHAVIFELPPIEVVDRIGAALNAPGSPFSEGVNVEFVEVSPDGRLDVVVYERGVGRTLACGTGACAVAFAAWREKKSSEDGTVVGLPGGDLVIRKGEQGRVWMRGGVERVYRGTLSDRWSAARRV